MEIRELRPPEYEDGGRVTALAYREFARSRSDWDGWDEYLGEIADVRGRADRTVVLGAVEGDRILGTATLEVGRTVGDDDETLPPDMASLRMLGVDPAARGRGIGRALVQAAVDRSRAEGKRVLVLRTTTAMKAAQHLYVSMGFQRDPVRDVVFESGGALIGYRLDL